MKIYLKDSIQNRDNQRQKRRFEPTTYEVKRVLVPLGIESSFNYGKKYLSMIIYSYENLSDLPLRVPKEHDFAIISIRLS